MRLDMVFEKRVITAGPETPLSEIAELMDGNGVGAVVVTDDERPVGIITDRDLAIALGTGRADRTESARTVMTAHVTTISCHEGIFAATRKFSDHGLRRLPIVDDDGRLAGLVTLDDLLILLGHEVGNLARSVRVELESAGVAPR
jgi:CBS domain-containing protein